LLPPRWTPSGALYVANVDREQVLVRLPDGRFRVVAGNGKKGVSGDGGPAIDAEFLDIVDMAVGPDGSLYVVDGDRVRVVSPNGGISTVAASPTCARRRHAAPASLFRHRS
jgi:serine/threonine-protein kinase